MTSTIIKQIWPLWYIRSKISILLLWDTHYGIDARFLKNLFILKSHILWFLSIKYENVFFFQFSRIASSLPRTFSSDAYYLTVQLANLEMLYHNCLRVDELTYHFSVRMIVLKNMHGKLKRLLQLSFWSSNLRRFWRWVLGTLDAMYFNHKWVITVL